jgi:hypothetical protein
VADEQLWESAESTCLKPDNDYRHFYMKKTCRSDWDNEETRASCRTESGPPLTSHRTNISYSNKHCAICNGDFDASTDHLWPVGYTCRGDDLSIYDAWIKPTDHKTTEVQLTLQNISQSVSVNYTFPVDIFSFHHLYEGTLGRLFDQILLITYKSQCNGEENSTQFSGSDYSYKWRMLPFNIDESIMRSCSYVNSTCASDWADSDVEAMCLAYTDYYCHGKMHFRNPHCALCNHVNLFETQICIEIVAEGLHKLFKLSHFDELLDFNQFSDMNPEEQNSTIIREANDGKLMFSYERA